MNFIRLFNLKPGDRIISPKSFLGLIQHHAIYLGQDFEGQDLIAENAFGKYVRIVTSDVFFSEYMEITSILPFTGSVEQREFAIKRALDQLGKPYDLINYNCEHFANLVQTNQIKSSQIGFAVFLILVFVIVIILND